MIKRAASLLFSSLNDACVALELTDAFVIGTQIDTVLVKKLNSGVCIVDL